MAYLFTRASRDTVVSLRNRVPDLSIAKYIGIENVTNGFGEDCVELKFESSVDK